MGKGPHPAASHTETFQDQDHAGTLPFLEQIPVRDAQMEPLPHRNHRGLRYGLIRIQQTQVGDRCLEHPELPARHFDLHATVHGHRHLRGGMAEIQVHDDGERVPRSAGEHDGGQLPLLLLLI